MRRFILCLLLGALALAGCAPALTDAPATPTSAPATTAAVPPPSATLPTAETSTPRRTPTEAPIIAALPTATLPPTPASAPGRYVDASQGVALRYPQEWTAQPGDDASTLTWVVAPDESVWGVLFSSPLPAAATLEQMAAQIRDDSARNLKDVTPLADRSVTLPGERPARHSEYRARDSEQEYHVVLTSAARGDRIFTLMFYGRPEAVALHRDAVDAISGALELSAPLRFGIPQDQALLWLGGESANPRAYDPATGGGNDLVFSGLVMFTPDLRVVSDLAASWDVSPDGTVYTFHLRPEARFHNGRPVTAQDVIYSWERAADPATESNEVLTYLGDIVGVRERHAGTSDRITGLAARDPHTLEVRIDAPKPYFVMKLTYATAAVVDEANVESGPEWYRTPNGTGPYRLIRWEPHRVQIYERNDGFYLAPPAVRYIIVQLVAEVGLRMYERGDIDITRVGSADVARLRDPGEPLHGELLEAVSMCTGYVVFDTTRPPFDDQKVRQAFALAVDRQQYVDLVADGLSLPARGLYPPALPGHDPALEGLAFDPALARTLLAESRYGGAEGLPTITFTTAGHGSDVSQDVAVLAAMWQEHLGVTIAIDNVEPDRWWDELHAGNHGQIFSQGWCADYPDPENFADALFHSQAQQNLGRYTSPKVDALLERARVERDPDARIRMYQEAERQIVHDAPAVFLSHALHFLLVKPRVKGYVLTPVHVPLARYLRLEPEQP